MTTMRARIRSRRAAVLLLAAIAQTLAIHSDHEHESPRKKRDEAEFMLKSAPRQVQFQQAERMLDNILLQEKFNAQAESHRILPFHAPTAMSLPTAAPVGVPTATPGATEAPAPDNEPTSSPAPTPASNGTVVPTPPVPTLNPSNTLAPAADCLGNLTRDEYLFELLSSVTDDTILSNADTAQGQAFVFMTTDDPLNPDVCTYPTLLQRYGLATLYYATTGDNWTDSDNWLETEECQWFGVICNDGTNAANLTLSQNQLAGTIPNEINTLPFLDRLELFDNALTSTVPTTVSSLTELNVLDLESNQLTGPLLSDDLLSLSSLNQLFLSSNSFTGTVPPNIDNLANLTDFWFATNQVAGELPLQLGNLTGLRTLLAYENLLDGDFPATLGTLTDLTNVQLYNNIIRGFLPDNLYNLTALSVLRLDFNFLSGPIATDIGALTALTDLRLNNNFFSGTVPSETFTLSSLETLALTSNFLGGTLPDSFADLPDLKVLDLSACFFEGTIPVSIFTPADIELVYLNNNAFIGPVPPSFTNASMLRDLYLDTNQLTGTIPTVPDGSLATLNELTLQFNSLEGSMPESICTLRTNGTLDDLFSDCGGASPEVACDFPDCCNRCFEGDPAAARRLRAALVVSSRVVSSRGGSNALSPRFNQTSTSVVRHMLEQKRPDWLGGQRRRDPPTTSDEHDRHLADRLLTSV